MSPENRSMENDSAAVDEIVSQAFNASSISTAGRLLRLRTDRMDPSHRLTRAWWLFLSRKTEACAAEVAALQLETSSGANAFSEEEIARLDTLRCRLALDSGMPLPELHAPREALPRWLQEADKDGMSLPGEEIGFSLEQVSAGEGLAWLILVCPACGQNLRFSTRSGLCPIREKRPDHRWHCPHCLASLKWEAATAREQAFTFFTRFLASLPRLADDQLSEEDAFRARAWVTALAPLGTIRFLHLYSGTIGDLAGTTAVYYRKKLAGYYAETLDFLGPSPFRPVCNIKLMELFMRYLPISRVATQLSLLFPYEKIVGDYISKSIHNGGLTETEDCYDLTIRYPFSFYFTDEEQKMAKRELDRMGIPQGAPFVCLHVRDYAYYRDYHAEPYRNHPVDVFKPVAEYLASSGYYVIRTGSKVEKAISWENDHIIDYASRFRTEFMDVWLFTYCDLVLSTSSGPDYIAVAQGKNVLLVGYAFTDDIPTYDPNLTTHLSSLFSNGKEMPLSERFKIPTSKMNPAYLRSNGYVFQPLDPGEILEAVQEKIFLMHGGTLSPEDFLLQKKFREFFVSYLPSMETQKVLNCIKPSRSPRHGSIVSSMSSVTLRKYRDELLNFHPDTAEASG